MCDIATGLMGASAVIGAAGALKSGTAAKNQADSEAALYRSQQAARLQKAEFDVETARRKYERNRGTVEARAADTGIDSANFYDILADDAEEAALERAAIRYTGKNEAAMLEYQASAASRRGKDAQTASYFNAAGAVVSSFSPMIRNRYSSSTGVTTGVSVDDSSPGYRSLK